MAVKKSKDDEIKVEEDESKAVDIKPEEEEAKAAGDAPAPGAEGDAEDAAEGGEPAEPDSAAMIELGDAIAVVLPVITELADSLDAGEVKSAMTLVLEHLGTLTKREKAATPPKPGAKPDEKPADVKGGDVTKAILAKLDSMSATQAAAQTALTKRLEALEKVRPVAKSEGGETAAVEKAKDSTASLFSGLFGK